QAGRCRVKMFRNAARRMARWRIRGFELRFVQESCGEPAACCCRRPEGGSSGLCRMFGPSSGHLHRELRGRAFRTQTVSEVGLGMVCDISFNRLPFAGWIVDFLAGAANPEEPAQFRQFPLLRFLEGPLGQDALGHVDAASDVALEGAVIGIEWNATVEDPAIFAVSALQPIVHFENFAPRERFEVSL